ncbi:MAG: PEP/pyruvate-binding domain-containing protein [Runella sp.]
MVYFFKDITPDQYHLLGGKGASLARMTAASFPVPIGFCITTDAFQLFMEEAGVKSKIMEHLECIDCKNTSELEEKSALIRELILQAPMPDTILKAISAAYQQLCDYCNANNDLPVAVRSSATAEDLPDASFAGQQDTYLWVVGTEDVLAFTKKCWASLYTARAINYRFDHQIAENDVMMSVVVQKMVNARTAGVAMTLNPINGDRSKIVIDASWGLGEAVVSGEVTPDNFLVDKVMLEVLKANIQNKSVEHIPDRTLKRVITREVAPEKASQPSLTDDEIKEICRIAKKIEKHYGGPQDIEWAIDADLPEGQNITLLQSRPETVWSQKKDSAPASIKTGMEGILNTLMNPLSNKKS